MTLPVEAPPGAAHNPVWEPGLDALWIPGGTFRMGSDRHYPEEAPVHRVRVQGFWMDRTPVTNRQFRAFVEATGYATLAEHPSDPKGKSGSLVFTPPKRPVDLRDWTQWWEFRVGANWRHPYGPSSSIDGQDEHPVVHVAYRDAEAFALWARKTLPTEAEWEFAARGGLDGADFAWGNDFLPGGRYMANTWQGAFPHQNLRHDGYEGTSPVTAFPANGYGLYDMTGNVWEWTTDWYTSKHTAEATGGLEADSYDPHQPQIRIPRKVLKGGSHLCAPNFCLRYRPAARRAQPVDTPAGHLGFRCIARKT